MHGFYADIKEKLIRFDVVLSFDIAPGEALATLHEEIKAEYPEYQISIVPDVDVSDIH